MIFNSTFTEEDSQQQIAMDKLLSLMQFPNNQQKKLQNSKGKNYKKILKINKIATKAVSGEFPGRILDSEVY